MGETSDRLWQIAPWALAVTLSVGAAWLFASQRPPFIDLPQHALTLSMLRHPEVYGEAYRVQLVPWTTNSLWFTLDPVLRAVLSPEASLKLCAWLAVVGTPLSLAWWTRARGGDPRLAVLVGWAAVWTRPMFWGFLHYALSLPVGIAALAVDLELQQRGWGRRGWRAVTLAVLLVGLFLLHAQTTAFVFGALGLQRLLRAGLGEEGPVGRRLGWRLGELALLAAPAVALFGVWVGSNLVAPEEDEAPLGTLTAGLGAQYQPLLEAVMDLVPSLQGFLKYTVADDVLAGVLLLAGAAGGALALRAAWSDRTRRAEHLAGVGIALTALLLFFFMPKHIRGQYYLSTRMAPWVLFALVPAVSAPLAPRWERARLGAAAGVAVAFFALAAGAFSLFAAEAAPLDSLLARIPPQQRVTLWAKKRSSRAVPSNPFTHYASWYAAEQQGTTTFSFASFRPNPVVYAHRDATHRSIPGEEFKQWCTAFAGQADDVDYVVLRKAEPTGKQCGARELYADNLEPVAEEGDWALLRVTTPLGPKETRCRCPKRRKSR